MVPLWVSRLFSRDKLNVILALAKRSQTGTQTFDPDGKKHPDLIDAVKTGLWAKEDAIHFCEVKASEVNLSPSLEDKEYFQGKGGSWQDLFSCPRGEPRVVK